MQKTRPALEEMARSARIPAGVLEFVRVGPSASFPTFSDRGEGAYLWDVHGKRYVDWLLGKGPVTLGHAYRPVDDAVADRMRRGINLALCPTEAVELAELLAGTIPAAEQSVFAKNGGDAVHAALRIARAYSGRDLVLSCGYHGWQDTFLAPGVGVPAGARHIVDFGYNLDRLETLCDEHRGKIAAVLVTPEPSFFGGAFLRGVAERARAAGALVIVDEIRCGFHLAVGGAHAHYKVEADLLTFSKGMANGYPLSAVAGRAEVMAATARTFIFGTYFFESAALAAALVAIRDSLRLDLVTRMWRFGQQVMDALDAVLRDAGIPARCQGPAPMFHILFKDERAEDLFFAEASARGVLFFPKDNQTICLAHGDDHLRETTEACAAAAEVVRRECYGNRRSPMGDISPPALARYERRRLIEPGRSERHVLALAGGPEAWM